MTRRKAQDELREIVHRRRQFERLIARRDVRERDYVRYIEYERELERTRAKRARHQAQARRARAHQDEQAQASTSGKKKNRSKGKAVTGAAEAVMTGASRRSLSDHSITAHITRLHQAGCARFPSSETLWDSLLAHALTLDSPQLASRTLGAAIAANPTKARYWLLASRFECDGARAGDNDDDGGGDGDASGVGKRATRRQQDVVVLGGGNEEGARRLCMRALRVLRRRGTQDEQQIWQEWLRVEVVHAERLRRRRAVLGLLDDDDDDDDDDDRAVAPPSTADGREHVQVPELEQEGERGGQQDGEDTEMADSQAQAAQGPRRDDEAVVRASQRAILNGALALVVVRSFLDAAAGSTVAYRAILDTLAVLEGEQARASDDERSVAARVARQTLDLLERDVLASGQGRASDDDKLAKCVLLADRLVGASAPTNASDDAPDMLRRAAPLVELKQGIALVDGVSRACKAWWALVGASSSSEATSDAFVAWLESTLHALPAELAELAAFVRANRDAVLARAGESSQDPADPLVRVRALERECQSGAMADAPLVDEAHSLVDLLDARAVEPSTLAFTTSKSDVHTLGAFEDALARTCALITSRHLGTSSERAMDVLERACRLAPWSSRVWLARAQAAEALAKADGDDGAAEWFERAIARVERADARVPQALVSAASPSSYESAREALMRRYVEYLTTASSSAPRTEAVRALSRLARANALVPLSALRQLRDAANSTTSAPSSTSTAAETESESSVHELVCAHPASTLDDWLDWAAACVIHGGVKQANEVVRRAQRELARRHQATTDEVEAAWVARLDTL